MKTILKRVLAALGVLIILAGAGVALFWEQLPIRLVLPYFIQEPVEIGGAVEKVQISGAAAGEQTFFVYLPEGYESGDQHYTTLYHLHGAFLREAWAGYECSYLGSKVEAAIAAGTIDPMIVVCLVDPDGDRMWSDSFDNQYLASTAFIRDLIPHIDASYRTIPDRSGRALQGFSMGGFGTLTNGFKAPDLFSALVVWDGALHDWHTLTATREGIASKMFQSEAYFRQWSPWDLTKNPAETDPDLFMVVGDMEATRDFGDRFRPHLESTGRNFTYFDVACPHSLFCMMDTLGTEAFAFLADSFAKRQ